MSAYAKAIVAAVIAVLTVAVNAISAVNGSWTPHDTLTVILAILGAVGVYFVPNKISQFVQNRRDRY